MHDEINLRNISKCLGCHVEDGPKVRLHPIHFANFATYLCDACFYKEIAQAQLAKVWPEIKGALKNA